MATEIQRLSLRKSKENPEISANRRRKPKEFLEIAVKLREASRLRPLNQSEEEELSQLNAEINEFADKLRSCLEHNSEDKTLMYLELGIIFGIPEEEEEIQTLESMEESITSNLVRSSPEQNTKGIDWALRISKYQNPNAADASESYARRLKDTLRMIQAWSLILVRLPANHLLCYKLVCKLWRHLISSPRFISAHFEHSKSDPSNHFLLVHEYHSRYSLKTPFRPVMLCISPGVAIVGSVNGLICVVENITGYGDIWISNPVTGHIMKLPDPSGSSSPFNYRTEIFAFVFWWDSISDEYKLAKIVSKPDNTTVASLWVSSSPETWSVIPVGFDGSFHNPQAMVSGCDVVLGDVAYWIVFELIDGGGVVGNLCVLSLDLKTLSLSLNENKFPLHFMEPKDLCIRLGLKDRFSFTKDASFLFAASWKGNFAVVEKDEANKVYNVWIMDDDAEGGWCMTSSFSEDFCVIRCMNNINGKSILFREVGGRNHTGISIFDIGTGEGELIECGRSSWFVNSAHDFVGSFVSIEGFKPPEAYGLKQLPHLKIFWPDPSPSKMSTNFFLIPTYERKYEFGFEDESENESEHDF